MNTLIVYPYWNSTDKHTLKLAAAGRLSSLLSSWTSGQALSASNKLIYPGAPHKTLKGNGASFIKTVAGF
jgi:hypothetical protein